LLDLSRWPRALTRSSAYCVLVNKSFKVIGAN
jgi:hypothetical protein